MPLFYIRLELSAENVDANISNYLARVSSASVTRAVNNLLFNKVAINSTDVWFSTDKNGTNPIAANTVYWSASNNLFAFDVKIPSVASGQRTTFYMQVGDRPAGYDENPYASQTTMILPLIENFNDTTTKGNDTINERGGLVAGGVIGPDGFLPATSYDGVDDSSVIEPGTILYSSAADASVQFWFYDAATQSGPEVLFEAGGVTQALGSYIENGTLYGTYNHINVAYGASSPYTAGQWNNVALVREDSGPTTLYLNGNPVATNNTIIDITSYGSNGGCIGSNYTSFRFVDQTQNTTDNALPFGGYIANVLTRNALITPEEVKLNYTLQGPEAARNWRADISFVGKVIV